MRWWYAYVPLHVAGSRGDRFRGKFQATEEQVREAFSSCATICPNGVIEFYKRPPKGKQ